MISYEKGLTSKDKNNYLISYFEYLKIIYFNNSNFIKIGINFIIYKKYNYIFFKIYFIG
jgi:hypothetical protein